HWGDHLDAGVSSISMKYPSPSSYWQDFVVPLRTWLWHTILTFVSLQTGESARTSAVRCPISSSLPERDSMRPPPLTRLDASSEHHLGGKTNCLAITNAVASTNPKGELFEPVRCTHSRGRIRTT